MSHLDLGALVEDLDAAIFTSDYLQDMHNRHFLKGYCKAWLREINRVDSSDGPDPLYTAMLAKLKKIAAEKSPAVECAEKDKTGAFSVEHDLDLENRRGADPLMQELRQ